MDLRTALTRSAPLVLGLLAGCAAAGDSGGRDPEAQRRRPATHERADDAQWSEAEVVDVTLARRSITVGEAGRGRVRVRGAVATITGGGVYRVSGRLADGQLVVDAGDAVVRLLLSGVDITSRSSAPLYVRQATKVIVLLQPGTTNVLSDHDDYDLAAGERGPSAPLFSEDDLTIYGDGDGSGALVVHARYEDGIVSKDGLVIANARISVEAAEDDGIRGRDYLVIRDSVIDVRAAGDALCATNDRDPGLGYVSIAGGRYTLTAGSDGIEAGADVVITRGGFTIAAGGPLGGRGAAKAIQAGGRVAVSGGTFVVDGADEALHSGGALRIAGR